MEKRGRPKLSELEKLLRKGKRLQLKIKELEKQVEDDPNGPYESISAVGRPPVKYKVQLRRAKDEYESIKTEARAKAEKEQDHIDIEKMIKDAEDPSIGSGIGRPKALEIQDIEYKIRQKEARIERIKDGKEKPELKMSEAGRQLGRLPKSNKEKIDRLESQILAMKAEIRALELKMTPLEREDMDIRRKRRVASFLRSELRREGLDGLRKEAHKNWEAAKLDRERFPAEVLEVCALERDIDARAKKLKEAMG